MLCLFLFPFLSLFVMVEDLLPTIKFPIDYFEKQKKPLFSLPPSVLMFLSFDGKQKKLLFLFFHCLPRAFMFFLSFVFLSFFFSGPSTSIWSSLGCFSPGHSCRKSSLCPSYTTSCSCCQRLERAPAHSMVSHEIHSKIQ